MINTKLVASAGVLLWASLLVVTPAAAQPASRAVLPPQASADCAGDVAVAVASDVAAQSDIYAAALLAASIGSDCIVLAGPRDQPMAPDQIERLGSARPGGFVVGGSAEATAGRRST